MLVWQLFYVVVASCGCLAATASEALLPPTPPLRTSSTATRFELKFQVELDNSTIKKRELQQQIFKCQVRLAARPLLAPARAKFKWSSTVLADGAEPNVVAVDQKWPANVVLSIDWYRNNQQLAGPPDSTTNTSGQEPVAVVNVELKSNSSSGGGGSQRQQDKKSQKTRIEIKNTVNGHQLKLTSRLKLNQLKLTDSGHYKCIARASFKQSTTTATTSDGSTPTAFVDGIIVPLSNSTTTTAAQQHQKSQVILVEQQLESSEAILMVASGGGAGANNDSGSQMDDDERARTMGESSGTKLVATRPLSVSGGGTKSGNGLDYAPTGARSSPNETQHATTTTTTTGTTQHKGAGYIRGNLGSWPTEAELLAAGTASSGNSPGATATAGSNHRRQHQHQGGPATQDDEIGGSGRTSNKHEAGKSLHQQQRQLPPLLNQFEDDEDLFKMGPDRIELISSHQQQQQHERPPSTTTNDDEDEAGDRRTALLDAAIEQSDRHQFMVGGADLSVTGAAADDEWASEAASLPPNGSPDLDYTSNESSATGRNNHHQRQQHRQSSPSFSSDQQNPIINSRTRHSPVGGHSNRAADTNYDGGQETVGNGGSGGVFASMDYNYFSGSLDSTRLRLVKFVHKIAPELSCYTGNGEHYRGNVSVSSDQRPCLNWLQMRRWYKNSSTATTTATTAFVDREDNHNHCRNPNMDTRGPWCFVHYVEELDGASGGDGSGQQRNLILLGPSLLQPTKPLNSGYHGGGSGGHLPAVATGGAAKYVQRQCSISTCSEYLWLYIVAPPLGLLALLSCLVAILIRTVRKSHYDKFMFTGQVGKKRKTLPRFNKALLLGRGAARFAPKKFGAGGAKKKSCGNYLEDDIFEIVDDIDFSDGQTPTLSPTSVAAESLKLNSSFSSYSNNGDAADLHQRASNGANQPTRLLAGRAGDQLAPAASGTARTTDLLGACNRSVTQVGPMFATLRCHIRSNSKLGQLNGNGDAGKSSVHNSKSTSTFIEHCNDPLATKHTRNPYDCNNNSKAEWTSSTGPTTNSDSSSSSSSSVSSFGNGSRQQAGGNRKDRQQSTAADGGGHLISCSSTTDNLKLCDCGEKFVNGHELPQLNASSVAIALDQQPIYEGKFSQVHMAYIKPSVVATTSTTATAAAHEQQQQQPIAGCKSDPSIGRIGTQVAVCSLKPNAAIDPAVFRPSSLKLRNLNHLNILRLIGYTLAEDHSAGGGIGEIGHNNKQQQQPCSLIYDMAQLVDLSDWLKQQNKDTMTSNEPRGNDLGIRRNLTCFAKQLALAIDYLHDQGIIYKDLACRNCFLDPTKMLVKLASFNVELVLPSSGGGGVAADDKTQNLKSMIRPKYLLDYYVIDSRPSDCQLLPLSWIPLESILFNKFNKHTDVWSFGCLLYELFSLGEVAYFGYSSKQVIDAVRSNLMPPQPLLCPNGIYKLMCNCLSDIPTIRPNVKQIYEQLNLYSGQCSSFLDHHLCSLATSMYDDHLQHHHMNGSNHHLLDLKQQAAAVQQHTRSFATMNNSITKTKSYANIRNFAPSSSKMNDPTAAYDNLVPVVSDIGATPRPEVAKLPLSKSINLGGNRLVSFDCQDTSQALDGNHYDEPVVDGIRND